MSEGTALQAAVSPDGSRLVLSFFGQLWMVPAQGGRARPLTNAVADPRHDQNPSWSPDGTHLAFTTRGSPTGLRILELETGRVESPIADRYDYEVAWSPDGRTIAWASLRSNPFAHRGTFGSPAIFLAALDAVTQPRQITPDPRRAGQPSFSPDGRTLAYAGPVSANFYATWPSWRTDLWELDLATGAERRLTSDSTLDGFPSYSPDGRWVAFISERGGETSVWLLPRSGGDPIDLTPRIPEIHLARPSWLPDSRGVVFTAAGQPWVAPLDRTGVRPIPFTAPLRIARWRGLRSPEFPPPGANRAARGITDPEISPDGQSVAFGSLGDLWVMNLATRAPRRLTSTRGDESRPRWSPDGGQIAYLYREDPHDPELRIIPAQGGSHRTVVQDQPVDPEFLWSRDGRSIFFVTDDRTILVATVATGQRRVLAAAEPGWFWLRFVGSTMTGDAVLFSAFDWQRGDATWRVPSDSGPKLRFDGYTRARAPFPARVFGVSPDLTRVVYLDERVPTVARLDPTGAVVSSTARPLPDAVGRHFSWSANSERLLYRGPDGLRLFEPGTGRVTSLPVTIPYQVASRPTTVLIRGVRVVDGTGQPPRGPLDVLILGNRITELRGAGERAAPQAARIIDGEGLTLLPGLLNLHVHGIHRADPVPLLYFGILGVRMMGGAEPEVLVALRERVEAGEVLGPRLFVNGANSSSMDPLPDGPEMRRQAELGVDVVKGYQLAPREAGALLDAAHAAGLRYTSHDVYLALVARGVDGKEHTYAFLPGGALPREDLTAALAAAGTCVTPTLVSRGFAFGDAAAYVRVDSSYLRDTALAVMYPPEAMARARTQLRPASSAGDSPERRIAERNAVETVRRLHRAGVPIATGTDFGLDSPWGALLVHVEIEFLVAAGFTPLEAIRAATFEGARCLGAERDLGSVEVGKLADLILVGGDPARDVRDLRRIVWVIRDGLPYTRDELLRASVRAGSGR